MNLKWLLFFPSSLLFHVCLFPFNRYDWSKQLYQQSFESVSHFPYFSLLALPPFPFSFISGRRSKHLSLLLPWWIYPSSSCIPPQCGGHPRPELRPILILLERSQISAHSLASMVMLPTLSHTRHPHQRGLSSLEPTLTHTWSLGVMQTALLPGCSPMGVQMPQH